MKVVTSIRIEPELLEKAKTKAKKENRPLGNYIETLIKNDLKKQ